MTDSEILAYASATNYAALYLDRVTRLGPGLDNWTSQLAMLTSVQRQALVTKINRQQVRLRREQAARCNNVYPQSIQRLAKQDSTPAPHQAAVWLSNGQ